MAVWLHMLCRYGSNIRHRAVEDKLMRQKAQLLLDEAASWSLLWYLYGKGNESICLIDFFFLSKTCVHHMGTRTHICDVRCAEQYECFMPYRFDSWMSQMSYIRLSAHVRMIVGHLDFFDEVLFVRIYHIDCWKCMHYHSCYVLRFHLCSSVKTIVTWFLIL